MAVASSGRARVAANAAVAHRGLQRRLAARMSPGAVMDLARGKALPPWHGCFVLRLRQPYAPSDEQAEHRRAMPWWQRRPAQGRQAADGALREGVTLDIRSHRLVTWGRLDPGSKETPACHGFLLLTMTQPCVSSYVSSCRRRATR